MPVTAAKEKTLYLKRICKEHLDDLLELEVRCHKRYDEDFEVETVPEWAWSRELLVAAIKQKENKKLGQFETRSFVVTLNKRVVGGIVYELVSAWLA